MDIIIISAASLWLLKYTLAYYLLDEKRDDRNKPDSGTPYFVEHGLNAVFFVWWIRTTPSNSLLRNVFSTLHNIIAVLTIVFYLTIFVYLVFNS